MAVARQNLQQLQALESDVNANPNRPEVCLKYVKFLHKIGENEKALAQISKFQTRFPSDSRFTQIRSEITEPDHAATAEQKQNSQLPALNAPSPAAGTKSTTKETSAIFKHSRYAPHVESQQPAARKVQATGLLVPMESIPVVQPPAQPVDPIHTKLPSNHLSKIEHPVVGANPNTNAHGSPSKQYKQLSDSGVATPARRKDWQGGLPSPVHGNAHHDFETASTLTASPKASRAQLPDTGRSTSTPALPVQHLPRVHAPVATSTRPPPVKMAFQDAGDLEKLKTVQSLARGKFARKQVAEIRKQQSTVGQSLPPAAKPAVAASPKKAAAADFDDADVKKVIAVQSLARGHLVRKANSPKGAAPASPSHAVPVAADSAPQPETSEPVTSLPAQSEQLPTAPVSPPTPAPEPEPAPEPAPPVEPAPTQAEPAVREEVTEVVDTVVDAVTATTEASPPSDSAPASAPAAAPEPQATTSSSGPAVSSGGDEPAESDSDNKTAAPANASEGATVKAPIAVLTDTTSSDIVEEMITAAPSPKAATQGGATSSEAIEESIPLDTSVELTGTQALPAHDGGSDTAIGEELPPATLSPRNAHMRRMDSEIGEDIAVDKEGSSPTLQRSTTATDIGEALPADTGIDSVKKVQADDDIQEVMAD